jgi:hypothetical protein
LNPRKKAEGEGWIYDYSKPLDMEYAWRKTESGIEIYTNDRIYYSPSELRILAQTAGQITPYIHLVKKIFKGIIVDSNSITQ